MSQLVKFDQKGAFGPAMTLMFNAGYYSPKAIENLAELLKSNYTHMSHHKPKGKKEFCAFLNKKNLEQTPATPTEIVGTRFFQEMQARTSTHQSHELAMNFVVPCMLKTVKEQFPEADTNASAIKEWTARFIESILTQEQIQKHSQFQENASSTIMEKRKKIGTELSETANQSKLTTKDLDAIITVCRSALKLLPELDHPEIALKFSAKYLALFSMNKENPASIAEDVLNLLNTAFRKKLDAKEAI